MGSNTYTVGSNFPSQLPIAKDVTDGIAIDSGVNAGVSKPCNAYTRMNEEWFVIKSLLGGTSAMRKADKTFLPMEVGEAEAAYQNRLKRSVLFNGFKRTVGILSSKPFLRPVDYGDMHETLKEYCDNIDLEGNRLDLFLWQRMYNALSYGHTFILVDHSKGAGHPVSKKDVVDLGLRPFWRGYSPLDIVGWQYENLNGRPVLTQARIKEFVQKNEGDYGSYTAEQIKVLEIGSWKVYEKDKNGNWPLIDEGQFLDYRGKPLRFIPLIPIYFDQTDFFTSRPPLLDLAYLNVHHWQSYSDYANILHVAQVPILFGKGFDEDTQVVVGASSMIPGPPESDLKFVEHSGKAIESGNNGIMAIEDRMRVMGSELLSKSKGVVTATQRTLENEENLSDLQRMALNMADGANQALEITALLAGVPVEEIGEITLFTDFSIMLNRVEDVKNLLAIRVARQMTQVTFLEECKRRGVLSDGLDVELEMKILKEEESRMADFSMDEMPEDEDEDENQDDEDQDDRGQNQDKGTE